MSEVCGECGASFGSASDLIDHARDHAVEVGTTATTSRAAVRFTCGLCGARFRTPEALRAHNLDPHTPRVLPTPRPARRSVPG